MCELIPEVTYPPQEITDLLERSDERDHYEQRIHAAWREGFAAGRTEGYDEGYEQSETDRQADWHRLAHPIAHPETYARELAARGLRAAEAGERRDATDHEHGVVARAHATHPRDRNDVQRATGQLYPPPSHLRRVK